MSPADQISDFTRRALAQGRSPDQIDAALAEAGWSERERQDALSAWQVVDGMAVPSPRPSVSAREALLYALLFILLGMVAFHLCQLGFLLVDAALPNITDPDPLTHRGMRWPMAALITFTPAFLLLSRALLRARQQNPGQARSWVRGWVASVTLLIAALTLLGDLGTTVFQLLDGEMTLRFALKAAIVGAVAGLVLLSYRDDRKHEALGAIALAVCALLAVIAGLVVGGGPMQARAENRDAARMEDLRRIDAQVLCQADALGRAPASPETTASCPADFPTLDPFTAQAYRYIRIDDRHWRVCATFENPETTGMARLPAAFDAQKGCLISTLPQPGQGPNSAPMDQFQIRPLD